MKKFTVETYYTCTFKTIHTLDELNDIELSKIDSRKDGEVEVIEVKLNNRKTKKIGSKDKIEDKKIKGNDDIPEILASKLSTTKNTPVNNISLNNKINISIEIEKMIVQIV